MTARPFAKPTATTKDTPLGPLILAALSAAAEEGKATGHWQEGGGSLEAIDVCAKKAQETQDAVFRRLREVAAEEIGGEGS
jgi:hypothetical protein